MPLKPRQNAMPDAIARVPQIPIAGILTPALPHFGQIDAQILPARTEKRPHDRWIAMFFVLTDG